MRLTHRLQGQKVKSQGHGAGAYCGGHLAAQLVLSDSDRLYTCMAEIPRYLLAAVSINLYSVG